MGKRKVKVAPLPAQTTFLQSLRGALKESKAFSEPQPMSDERMKELRLLAVNFRDVRDAVAEIDWLRAEVAAKDAEIARLKGKAKP